eukprot:SAG11_NODE_713_length_7636_cov_3.456415_2_plen_211_part_00
MGRNCPGRTASTAWLARKRWTKTLRLQHRLDVPLLLFRRPRTTRSSTSSSSVYRAAQAGAASSRGRIPSPAPSKTLIPGQLLKKTARAVLSPQRHANAATRVFLSSLHAKCHNCGHPRTCSAATAATRVCLACLSPRQLPQLRPPAYTQRRHCSHSCLFAPVAACLPPRQVPQLRPPAYTQRCQCSHSCLSVLSPRQVPQLRPPTCKFLD